MRVGTLVAVERRRIQNGQEYLSLVVTYEGRQLLGSLLLDQALLERLHSLFTQHLGEPLAGIGRLEIPA